MGSSACPPRRRDLNGQRALTAVRVLQMHSTVQRPGGVRRSRERPRPEHGWCAAPLIIFPDEVGQRAAAQRWRERPRRRAREPAGVSCYVEVDPDRTTPIRRFQQA